MHHAGAFAQHIHRTNARAAQSQNIRIQNGQRAPTQIPARDLLDESRHVNVRGASRHAGGVETEQTPIGFHYGGLRIQSRMQFPKPCQIVRERNSRAHLTFPATAAAQADRLLSSSVRNWSTSVRPTFMGGEMRSTLP